MHDDNCVGGCRVGLGPHQEVSIAHKAVSGRAIGDQGLSDVAMRKKALTGMESLLDTITKRALKKRARIFE